MAWRSGYGEHVALRQYCECQLLAVTRDLATGYFANSFLWRTEVPRLGVGEFYRNNKPEILIGSLQFQQSIYLSTDRDSSVGIATRYGLDGPGIESRWGGDEIFRTCPDRP